ncbi:MAG: SH3 domain-containing protein [Clostridia bacterium]|nr:SH3 domain-containing protein [Clostridia bacterium]
MLKKLIALALVIMSIIGIMIPVSMAENVKVNNYSSPMTMYVYTEDRGTLNVRNTPRKAERSIIGELPYGAKVTVLGICEDAPAWVCIKFSRGENGVAYVMAQFLSNAKPTGRSDIDSQMVTYKTVSRCTIAAKPRRAEGWVNFRAYPSTESTRIRTLKLGHTLTVIGETRNFYHAIDNETGKLGYVDKAYVTRY